MYIDLFGSCYDLLVKPLPLYLYSGESSDISTNDLNNGRFGHATKVKRLPFSFIKYEKENLANNAEVYEAQYMNQPLEQSKSSEIEIYQNPNFAQTDNNAIF